ncbi:alpha/beta hydrolase [Photobacterium satsumensis]|uniref:alpha/beta hydrolase n=1 Tax=Photobacterium satsumensis TaxID=2910239 RepID=UPI003D0EC4D0
MKYKAFFLGTLVSFSGFSQTLTVNDPYRGREIPVSIDFPSNAGSCKPDSKCRVAFISAGNKVPYTKYQFISQLLNENGYMTVAVNHELPNDPPLSKQGDLYQTRIENWQRGAATLNFLQHELPHQFSAYEFNDLTLVGHSNGGDISTWLTRDDNDYVRQLITLDHKRVALPKSEKVRVLSIRATEYPTKEGVLLTTSEQEAFGGCVVEIKDAKHMDLSDYGSLAVKQTTKDIVGGFLAGSACDELQKQG